jgi:uncharacterized membrane protein YkvA (DUF1232 family)
MNSEEPQGFEQAQSQAESYARDKNKARKLVENVIAKAYRNRNQLKSVWENLMSLCRMIRAWAKGEYRALPWKTIVMALAATLYFLDPLDLAPDFIPGVGYLDDAAVLGFVIRSIQKDLGKFLDWESSSQQTH